LSLIDRVQLRGRTARRLRPISLSAVFGALSPNLIFAGFFFLAPVVFVLLYSLGTLSFLTLEVHWGWTTSSYSAIVHAPYLTTFVRALWIAVATVALCAPLGFAISLVIVRASPRRKVALFLLVLFPFWTSFIVRTYAWTNILGPRGYIANLTADLGHRVTLLGTDWGILIGMVAAYLPMMALPVYVSLSRVPDTLVAAARDLGAGEWRIMRTLLIPGAAPGLAAGALLVGIPASGEYVVPAVLGAGKVTLVGGLLAQELQDNGNYPLGAALTVGLIVLMMLMLIAARLLQWLWSRRPPAPAPPPPYEAPSTAETLTAAR
jgi:spermidine/putrescine transport system permease protein